MNRAVDEIKKYSLELLEQELHYGKVRQVCNDLYTIFSRLTGFDHDSLSMHADESTNTGTAIGPYNAAFCLVDFMRSRQFIRGIDQAIKERLSEKAGPLTILYAGTGPFASLLTPLCTIYKPDQIKLVLLEYNPVSYDHMRHLLKALDLESYILFAACTDAASWKIPGSMQPDIVVCETMNKALEKEPQVELVSFLLSHCTKDPILIPETIRVTAALKRKNGADFRVLKTLFELDKTSVSKIGRSGINSAMPETILELPADADKYQELFLLTEVTTYKDHSLRSGECAITLPLKLKAISELSSPIRLIYEMGERPGFRMLS